MASTRINIQEVPAIPSAKRRMLLSTLVLGAGSLALAACGGGGGGDKTSFAPDSGSSSSSRSSGAGSASVAGAPTSTTAPGSSANTNTNTNTNTSPGTDSQGPSNASTSGVMLDTSFGVKGDGTTNDRAALQAAIDGSVGQILLITGKSRIDVTGLTLRSDTHIRFAKGASIKLLPHNSDSYQILRVWDVNNVSIEAPYLDGSKELNSATSGEWGMGISIAGSSNVTITSPTTSTAGATVSTSPIAISGPA